VEKRKEPSDNDRREPFEIGKSQSAYGVRVQKTIFFLFVGHHRQGALDWCIVREGWPEKEEENELKEGYKRPTKVSMFTHQEDGWEYRVWEL